MEAAASQRPTWATLAYFPHAESHSHHRSRAANFYTFSRDNGSSESIIKDDVQSTLASGLATNLTHLDAVILLLLVSSALPNFFNFYFFSFHLNMFLHFFARVQDREEFT